MKISLSGRANKRIVLSLTVAILCLLVVSLLAVNVFSGTPKKPLSSAGKARPILSASDHFTRADGGLGADWTATKDGGMTISSSQALGSSGNSGDMWTANSFASNQYSQVTLTATQLSATQWVGPSVRTQDTGLNAYVAIYFWNNGDPEILLFLRSDGSWVQLGNPHSVNPLGAGTVLGLKATGASLSVTVNGTLVISATDTRLTGGAPGLMTNGPARAAAWAGGSGAPSTASGSRSSATYSVGGTVSGLSGTVVLQDNGGDSVTVKANGAFTFTTRLTAETPYAAAVATNPPGQVCTVASGTGSIESTDITTVTVTCAKVSPLTVRDVSTAADGVTTYNMTSSIVSNGATEPLRVLKPTHPARSVAHNFLIAMPVEPGEGTTYGDAMSTLESLNAQNQYNLTIIEPSFNIDPWYGDSATDSGEQMETFMTDQLVPWIKANLATTGTEQVWLLSFSKSGLGAQDLVLKHPDVFTLAASWDFPATMGNYDQFVSDPQASYGTNANYLANYDLTQTFLAAHSAPFTTQKRIWIGGYHYFDWDVTQYASLLTNAGILYDNAKPVDMAHRWDSGWVPEALAALYQDSIKLHS
jgi:hypothetical protein